MMATSTRTQALNAKPYSRPRQSKATAVSPFQMTVYGIVKQIPSGGISTYGTIAKHLHTSSQAVGNALRNNPYAPTVPCHRVVATDGKLRGFFGDTSAEGRVGDKAAMLRDEGVRVDLVRGEWAIAKAELASRLWHPSLEARED